MFKIKTLNNISPIGLKKFNKELYHISNDEVTPDAILLRSFNMHDMDIPSSLKAVGRAGAGVNNIPVKKFTGLGIPVFNAAGANANAVNELVFLGALMAYRNVPKAMDFVANLSGDDQSIHQQVEQGKKQFVGKELAGRTLGVIGLGAIGVRVANTAHAFGMNVIGFDPAMSVQRAWQLSSNVKQAASLEQLCKIADVITVHVPLMEATKNLLSGDRLRLLKNDAVILNFARDGIIDEIEIMQRLDANNLRAYVTDFPDSKAIQHPKVIALPHLGASTNEAEVNCAVMVGEYVRNYLEFGNISGSVNFPEVTMPSNGGHRLTIANANIPNMVSQITKVLAEQDHNILDMMNRSREDIAYTLVDVDKSISTATLRAISDIKGVLAVNVLSSHELSKV